MVTEEAPGLSHLHPAAREAALLPPGERLEHARADRWIGYTRATQALRALEDLFTWPARPGSSRRSPSGPALIPAWCG